MDKLQFFLHLHVALFAKNKRLIHLGLRSRTFSLEINKLPTFYEMTQVSQSSLNDNVRSLDIYKEK